MSLAYWIVAGPLALFYGYAGTLKTVRSPDRLRPMMAWVDRVPPAAVRTLGVVEVLGAAGLLLPLLTGIAPALAPAAAIGLVLLQGGAVAVHLTGGDRRLGLNAALVIAAAVAAWLAAGP
ncbi:DoxX family protein [Kitasatospora sp. NPDC127059]|uniref:DoxX family protein n=1 Tax=unclassified Kitasatospora TaxID=2633591 RepID=UPI00366A4930